MEQQLILTYLFGVFMVGAGITHFLKTKLYLKLVPEIFPYRVAIVWISGVVEILLGIGLFIPATQTLAAQGIFLLMIAFLPLHIWDIFRDNPAFGSKKASLIRLPFQFVLIYWAWWII